MAKETSEKRVLLYIEGEHIPAKATEGSVWIDLAARENVYIASNSFWVVGLGVKSNFSSIVAGRSSLYKKNVIFGNGIGVIDEDYRGEIKAVLYNIKEYGINISKGDVIAQLIAQGDDIEIKAVSQEEWDAFGEKNPTERWEGGFGSTDVKWASEDPAVNAWDDKSEDDGEEAGDDSGAESNEADDSVTGEAQGVWDWTSEGWSEQSAESAEQGDEGDDKRWDVEKASEPKSGDNKASAKQKGRK